MTDSTTPTQSTPGGRQSLPPLQAVEPGSYLSGQHRDDVAQATKRHYDAGLAIGGIASQLKLSPSTVTSLILEAGGTIRPGPNRRKPDPRFDELIATYYGNGESATAIAKLIRRSRNFVTARLIVLGLRKPRESAVPEAGTQPDHQTSDNPPAPLPRLAKGRAIMGVQRTELAELVATHYLAGRTMPTIAAELGRSNVFVLILLAEAGVPRRPMGGRCRPSRSETA